MVNRERDTERQGSKLIPVHPLEIKPLGNAYTANGNIRARAGLFAIFPDEMITQVLEYLDSVGLLRLSYTCKALYAFSRQEELWKTICLG